MHLHRLLVVLPPDNTLPSGTHIRDRTATFIAAYREAKKRKILTCPRFTPRLIGIKIDSFCDKSLS